MSSTWYATYGTARRFVADLFKDVRYGTRMLLKTPVVSLAAVLTIGLGIGGIALVAAGVYGMMLRGLPVEDGDRVMRVYGTVVATGEGRAIPIHDLVDWQAQQSSFEELAAFLWADVNLADTETHPQRYNGARVTANLFAALNTQPLLGRVFREEENAGHTAPTIILSYEVWRDRYGSDPDILDKTIRANGVPRTVVGIMPEEFRFPFDHDVWMPLGVDPRDVLRGRGPPMLVIGRLQKDVSAAQAQAQLEVIASRLATAYPETNEGLGTAVRPYVDAFMPSEITNILWVEVAAAIGVLFIACANVANLMLARSAARAKEMAIRTAVGASRARVIRQLLVEATIVGVVGGIVGLVLAVVLTNRLRGMFEVIEKPYWLDIGIEIPIVLFIAATTLIASIASGIVPAIKATGIDVQETLKDQSGASSSLRMGRFSAGLVVTEIALSCALLVSAGIMIRSVMNFQSLDLGFETANVFTGRVALIDTDYPDDQSRMRFYDELLQRLVALPGADTAALVDALPAAAARETSFGIEGVPYLTDRDYPLANRATITPGFFNTFGVEVRAGRDFSIQDRRGNQPVAIVNESFRRRYFSEGDALGRRLRVGRSDSQAEWRMVIGVVPDLYVGDGDLGGMRGGRVTPEQFYTPLAQSSRQTMWIVVKTFGDPLVITPSVRDAVTGLDPNLPLYDADSMEGALRSVTWSFGMLGWTFSMFGAIALLMAAVGLYGVIASSVGRRRREMGIRMALGAYPNAIMTLVLGQGMKQIGIGMAIGLVLGAAISRPLQLVSFRVNPNDPAVYGAVILTLTLTGILACIIPAFRATRVNVVDAVKAQ